MWFTSKWQSCNKLCDAGKQTRQVICIRIEDNGRISVSDGKDCQDEKPVEEKECLIHPCEGVEFMASTWSGVGFKKHVLGQIVKVLFPLVRCSWNNYGNQSNKLCI